MRMGRPPKSAEEHLLEGTFRSDRHGGRGAASGEELFTVPKPPPGLDATERKAWRRVCAAMIERRLLFHPDLEAVTAAARAIAQYERSTAELATAPLTVPGSAGQPTPHPLLKVVQAGSKEVRAWLTTLGLTPSARQRVPAPSSKGAADPWERMLGGGDA